jgi:uncharacterized membrane protein YoaK (UPF0700 family)
MSEILNEAWHTLAPEREDRHGPLAPMMALLTVVTGFVDSYSYLVLGHVFVANMTGNVVFAGFALAGSSSFSLGASVVALAAFAIGAFLGGKVARGHREHRGRLLYNALLIQFVLLAAAYFIAQFGPAPGAGSAIRYLLIVLLGLAMGLQNSIARHLAVPDLTTTVLTMTITGTAADTRVGGGTGSRAGRRMLSVLAMFMGALFGALFILNGHPGVALLCAVVLLAIATFAAERTLSSEAAWTQP